MKMLMQSLSVGGRSNPQPSQPSLLSQLWQETRWSTAIGWFSGMAAGAFWIYSGMPMICH
jgi:hypothetical protein